jgi:hypothetical protein
MYTRKHQISSHCATFMLVSLIAGTTAIAGDACVMGTNDAPSVGRKSVVLTSKDIDFSKVDFSLGHTLGRLIETASPDAANRITDSPGERAALLQSLLRSLQKSSFINPNGNTTVPVQPRPEATEVTTAELLDPDTKKGMHPVALFNRFDLAPFNFENCGEHRIVYMLGDGTTRTHRMTLIFEARVKNPHPELAQRGCLPIAQFWKNLEQKNPADAAKALEAFFYLGDLDGDGTIDLATPVVDFTNYGFNRGQVRGNLFVTPAPNHFKWQLREWHTDLNPDGSPYFRAEPVKDAPIAELWGDVPAGPLASLRSEFARDLVTANLNRLLAPERASDVGDPVKLVADIGADFGSQFDDFQSVSQGSEDEPAVQISPQLKTQLEAKLNSTPGTRKPTIEQILNRAGAVTCGGCHDFSRDKTIGTAPDGTDITWPAPAPPGFVHTLENGDLSPALMERFLVFRCRNLDGFISNPDRFGFPQSTPVVAEGLDVPDAIAKIQSESSLTDRLNSLSVLTTQSEALRQSEEQQPGAFVPVRRVH